MKKLLLGFVFAGAFLVGFAQSQVFKNEVTTIVDSLDLSTISGSDTTIYVYAPNGLWSVDIRFATITGSGTAAVVCSHDGTNFYAYNTSPSVTVTGASGSYQFEDDRLVWPYIGIKISKSTITAGTLNATILVR